MCPLDYRHSSEPESLQVCKTCTIANGIGRTEILVPRIRQDKVAAIPDMAQHEDKNICLPRLRLDVLQRAGILSEIKRIMYGIQQSFDFRIKLNLCQKGLAFSELFHLIQSMKIYLGDN